MKPWMFLGKLWGRAFRAEYWWQQGQIARRFRRRPLAQGCGRQIVTPAWGLPIEIDPSESSGRSLLALNVLDLPVLESIWRLLNPGDRCADIGANIGCMTGAMAARLAEGGEIFSFEPVPELAHRIRRNLDLWSLGTKARTHVEEAAVSDRQGESLLHLPPQFDVDRDVASLDESRARAASRTIRVGCVTLDEYFAASAPPALLKIDVEGCEARVFRGARRLLSTQSIRDIVFEELQGPDSESIALIRQHGYTVFRIARGFRQPELVPPGRPHPIELDSPSYLATADPARAVARFAPTGWQIFQASRP